MFKSLLLEERTYGSLFLVSPNDLVYVKGAKFDGNSAMKTNMPIRSFRPSTHCFHRSFAWMPGTFRRKKGWPSRCHRFFAPGEGERSPEGRYSARQPFHPAASPKRRNCANRKPSREYLSRTNPSRSDRGRSHR